MLIYLFYYYSVFPYPFMCFDYLMLSKNKMTFLMITVIVWGVGAGRTSRTHKETKVAKANFHIQQRTKHLRPNGLFFFQSEMDRQNVNLTNKFNHFSSIIYTCTIIFLRGTYQSACLILFQILF